MKGEAFFAAALVEDFGKEVDFEVFDFAQFILHGGGDDVVFGLEGADGADHVAGLAEVAALAEREVEFLGCGDILLGDMVEVVGTDFFDFFQDG